MNKLIFGATQKEVKLPQHYAMHTTAIFHQLVKKLVVGNIIILNMPCFSSFDANWQLETT